MPSSLSVSTKLQRIAELARNAKDMAFTSLSHHIDVEFLLEAYKHTKAGAPGVDGLPAGGYGDDTEEHLQSLLDRFKSGQYYAPPVKRVYIPKGDGKSTRPIGIPTFEDKLLQRAVAMVLGAVYEQDFLDCSYGFRPGRSAHDALDALWRDIMKMRGGYVLEVDIQSFFDTLDHGHLRNFLDRRVRDGVLRRTIDKWLKAGVMEDGRLWYPDSGTPQGGSISPLLSNIYLHEVLDEWFVNEVKPTLIGEAVLIRYADDFVLAFALESDARRVLPLLRERFAAYGLTLHPEKTRLLPFGPPDGSQSPGTFDLLGFTHYWGKSRRGNWVVKRKTAASRFARTLRRIGQWCRRFRHLPVSEQHEALSHKLRGHYSYFGITGNFAALSCLRHEVERVWHKWLSRRSQRAHIWWGRFREILSRFALPAPRIVHSVYRRQRTRVSRSRMR